MIGEIMSTKAQREQQEQSIYYLRGMLTPGQTVYTNVKHVSRSGMSRVISAHILHEGEIIDVSWHVARAIGASFDHDRWGVKMGGCGMDMAFAVVYSLGRAIWSGGVPCTGSKTGYTQSGRKSKNPRCLSNDHTNGDRVYRKGKIHRDGGYALSKKDL